MQGSVDTDGTVREAADLLQGEGARPDAPGHHPPAGRPEIDGREHRFTHAVSLWGATPHTPRFASLMLCLCGGATPHTPRFASLM
ncbi:hypothetical protein GCM10010187_53970 [Actinomadura coerulea]|nr:hypothetical protein GCM10010187_53970 [Actinomadura coerulea]